MIQWEVERIVGDGPAAGGGITAQLVAVGVVREAACSRRRDDLGHCVGAGVDRPAPRGGDVLLVQITAGVIALLGERLPSLQQFK